MKSLRVFEVASIFVIVALLFAWRVADVDKSVPNTTQESKVEIRQGYSICGIQIGDSFAAVKDKLEPRFRVQEVDGTVSLITDEIYIGIGVNEKGIIDLVYTDLGGWLDKDGDRVCFVADGYREATASLRAMDTRMKEEPTSVSVVAEHQVLKIESRAATGPEANYRLRISLHPSS